jgi:hypothetical protein
VSGPHPNSRIAAAPLRKWHIHQRTTLVTHFQRSMSNEQSSHPILPILTSVFDNRPSPAYFNRLGLFIAIAKSSRVTVIRKFTRGAPADFSMILTILRQFMKSRVVNHRLISSGTVHETMHNECPFGCRECQINGLHQCLSYHNVPIL